MEQNVDEGTRMMDDEEDEVNTQAKICRYVTRKAMVERSSLFAEYWNRSSGTPKGVHFWHFFCLLDWLSN